MTPPNLIPEQTRQAEQIQNLFDKHLKDYFVEDLKILVSTHAPSVTAAIIGFIWVVALMCRLFFGFD